MMRIFLFFFKFLYHSLICRLALILAVLVVLVIIVFVGQIEMKLDFNKLSQQHAVQRSPTIWNIFTINGWFIFVKRWWNIPICEEASVLKKGLCIWYGVTGNGHSQHTLKAAFICLILSPSFSIGFFYHRSFPLSFWCFNFGRASFIQWGCRR